MGKPKKARKPKPRVAKGFRDLTPAAIVERRRMIETVSRVYERYGFTPLETPGIEYVDVLGKFLPEAETPAGGIFAFKYDDEEWVALRYDLTAPLSRYVAKNQQELGLPFRRYQAGNVWRMEKPEPGRYREFMQLDIDIVGAASTQADAEIVCVLAEAMEALGIPRGSYQVRLNDRKVLNGLLERAGVPEEKGADVLRALDKMDRLGEEGVAQLLGAGRRDTGSEKGEGDFTKGAELSPEQIETLVSFVRVGGDDRAAYLAAVTDLVTGSAVGEEGLAEMTELDAILTERGVGPDQVVFSPAVVRGLAYYTGPVVEVALTFPTGEGEEQREFGSVAGGGRYDDLIARFTGQKVPATGASIGVDRLLAALQALGKVDTQAGTCPVLITQMDKSQRATYQRWANELREAGLPVELYVGGGNVGKQMKYADRRNFSVAVIAGGDEMEAGEVSLKDLRLGKELSQAEDVADRKAWLEKLPGQERFPQTELVAKVKEFLGRYDVEDRTEVSRSPVLVGSHRAGMDDFGSGDYTGFACVVLAAEAAGELQEIGRRLLSAARIPEFHGNEFDAGSESQLVAYEEFARAIRDAVTGSAGYAAFHLVHKEVFGELFRGFSGRVADGVLEKLGSSASLFLRGKAGALLYLSRDLQSAGGVGTVDLFMDCDQPSDLLAGSNQVVLTGNRGTLATDEQQALSLLGNAYKKQRFDGGLEFGAIRVCDSRESILVQAADLLANFGVARVKSAIRKATSLGESTKVRIFDSIAESDGEIPVAGLEIGLNGLVGPREFTLRLQLR